VLAGNITASTTFLGPTPYLSFADSPFNGVSFSYLFLKTYEDGTVSSTGVTTTAGVVVLGPGPLTDSVDADDGAIDGSGTGGHSLYTNFLLNTIRFSFDAGVLGGLPTRAGVVWTDVGATVTGTGFGAVTFAAFGPGGSTLGTLGPFSLGDGNSSGATAEDRFLGVINTDGISAIEITMPASVDWEVDHLQYGLDTASAVPEPAPSGLLLLGLGAMAIIARQHKCARGRDAAS